MKNKNYQANGLRSITRLMWMLVFAVAIPLTVKSDEAGGNIARKSESAGNGNRIAPEDTSLVGWWKLDEKSGTMASDSSGHGNRGKLIGGPTWVDGRIGGALHFANTDDTKIHVDIPNSPSLENVQEGDWTVAAWVWPDHLPPGTDVTPAYGIIIKQGRHIGLVYDEDGLFKMQHHSSAGYSLAKSAPKSPRAWYYVAGVASKKDGVVKIYVNGKLESAVDFTPGATAVEFGTRTWKLGIAGPDYTKFREAMTGRIDDVRIYSRALSDAEIAAMAAQADPQSADRNDWPQFRGSNRDGKSPETRLLKVWPETGPRLVRTISGFGGGFSSPVISGGRIFITGKVGADLRLFCFDLSGKEIWSRTHAPAFREGDAPHSPYPGARATPTIDGGTVVWLFNQHLVTGAQRRDMIVPPNLRDDGRLLNSFKDVNRFPYGHLHLPDKSNNYGGMIEAMVDVLTDPRVWTQKKPNVPNATETMKD